MSNGKLFVGMALGALAGSAFRRFAHSDKGRKLKSDICDMLQEWQGEAIEYAHRAKYKAQHAGNEMAAKAEPKMEGTKCHFTEVPIK